MTEDNIGRLVSELQEAYPGATVAREGRTVMVKLKQVHFPHGCLPESTEALVLLDPAQPKPRILVRHKPRTPGGMDPRNVNSESAASESWFGFSYNVPWEEGRHTAVQFVASAMRRFARDE